MMNDLRRRRLLISDEQLFSFPEVKIFFEDNFFGKSKLADLTASTSTTGLALINQDFYSEINRSGDVDWIRVQLQAGKKYQISLNGSDSSDGTLSDPVIKGIYDSRGRSLGNIGFDDDSGEGRNAFLNFVAPSTDNFFIAASAYGRLKGTYKLNVLQDSEAPQIINISPVDGALAVSPGSSIQITFDEPVFLGNTGYFRLLGDDQTNILINVQDSSQVQVINNVAILNPTQNLNSNVTYSLSIDQGVILDKANNIFLGLNDNYSFTVSENLDQDAPLPPIHWNIMVYIAGDNNLEPYALTDVNEMESVAMYENLAITALIDRSSSYSIEDDNWSDTRVAKILPDASTRTVSFSNEDSWGELNTGNHQTLTDFILWSIQNHPAENYALVVWDHGAGIDGIAWDDQANSHLSVLDVTNAIANAVSYSQTDSLNKFEIVAMDACLMAMAEVAYPLIPYTNYFIASQELIPGTGFAYDNWLDCFASSSMAEISTLQLVNEALTSYDAEYQGERDITLSAMDMSLYSAFVDSLNHFTEIALTINAKDIRNISKTIAKAVDFPSDQSYDFADLGHAMDLIAANRSITHQGLKISAAAVSDAIDNLVIGEVGSVTSAQGLSIYMPYGSELIDSQYSSDNFAFLQAVPLWDDFLRII
jgi:hypothetical protein